MTVLCYPLVALLLTGKRRSTVEPGTCEDSLWLALQHGCTARDSRRIGRTRLHATDVYGHITLAAAVPPPGEGRAPAAGTNRAPRGNRQVPAVDEGPFLSRTQGSSAPPGDWAGLKPFGRRYQPRHPHGRPSGRLAWTRVQCFSVQNSGNQLRFFVTQCWPVNFRVENSSRRRLIGRIGR